MSRRNNADQGQPSTRRPGVVYDQHVIPGVFPQGRPWRCEVDNRSGYPLGPFQPLGWRAPWIPSQGAQIFKSDPNNPTRITINYQHLLDERMKARQELDSLRTQAAVARGWDPQDPSKQAQLDQMVGKSSGIQPPEIVVACMQGDRWILGATDTVNPKVERFLPKKVSQTERILAQFPDFTSDEGEPASLADDLEGLMDIEEDVDPDATPRGRVPVKPKRQKRTPQLDPAA